MLRYVTLVLLLLACCRDGDKPVIAPIPDEPIPATLVVPFAAPAPLGIDAMAKALAASPIVSTQPKATRAAGLTPEPRGLEPLTTSQITVVIEGHYDAMQTRDGGWVVQVPPSGAKVVSYVSAGGTGAAMNVRGTNTTAIHEQQLQLPRAVVPGDALVVASKPAAVGARDAYWPVPGRSGCDEMLPVVFVPYALSPGLLRPPAVGEGVIVRFFRSAPIPEALVDVSRLPDVVEVSTLGVNWSGWGAAEPTIPYLTALLQRFAGDCFDGWGTDTQTPDMQHPGYGSYYASVVSQALVQLCSTSTDAQKLPLAMAVAQRGLDIVGAFADGRRNYPLGGHSQGRKALLVMTGHMMNIEPFANPSRYVGPMFMEDGGFFTGAPAWWFGWTGGWRFRLEPPFDGRMLANEPNTWGSVDAPNHDTWAWMVGGYIEHVLGAQTGTALAMRLTGRVSEMNPAMDQMIAQWMEGPPAEAKAKLDAQGLAGIRWGTDYAAVKGAGFSAAAWRKYAVR